MTRQEFAAVVRHLCEYFGQAEPPPGQLEAWFGVLGRYAGGAELDLAVHELKLAEGYFPRNLPRALIVHLPRFKAEPRPSVPCDDCGGTGLLSASRLGPDGAPVPGEADHAFRCGRCLQSPMARLPAVSRADLPGLGFLPRR